MLRGVSNMEDVQYNCVTISLKLLDICGAHRGGLTEQKKKKKNIYIYIYTSPGGKEPLTEILLKIITVTE